MKGLIHGLGLPGIRTLINAALDALNAWTIAVPATIDASATYQVVVTQITGTFPLMMPVTVTVTTAATAPTQAAFTQTLLDSLRADLTLNSYFSITSSGNTITLKAVRLGDSFSVTSPSNATTTNDLALAETVAMSRSGPIPFGRFLVQKISAVADKLNVARLPTTATGVRVAGVTVCTYAIEKDRKGADAKTEYQPNEGMDVLHQQAATLGIDVECDSVNLNPVGALYIDCVTAGKQGRITSVATNNLPLPSGCSIVDGPYLDVNNEPCVKVKVSV
jgi:hypothetical protein